ncbi:MAG: DUF2332 domain-containing protein [Acetobacteraceae bacterium]|nr:DUF2332 domain-containing protein [Acetobacteraceae bacterium]
MRARYQRFAEAEARGRSPLYEALALGVAQDAEALAFLATLPPAKQQPNLLFAALQHVCGTARDYQHFRTLLRANRDAVRAVMMQRRTQTNEPARCAVLIPVMAQLPQPLALIEVGASAGLCLLMDRYGYDYGGHVLAGTPCFSCRTNSQTPIPDAAPVIAWRAGLDLAPIDVTDDTTTAWLETLVWPEQTDRLTRLRAAIAVARQEPPLLVKADLDDLPHLAAQAPRDATLVVYHSAVLGCVESEKREAFAHLVRQLGAVWISNEGVGPEMADAPSGAFLLSLDSQPVAWTDPHGAWIEYISLGLR